MMAEEPFQRLVNFVLTGERTAAEVDVPAGRRLRIDCVALWADLPTGVHPQAFFLTSCPGELPPPGPGDPAEADEPATCLAPWPLQLSEVAPGPAGARAWAGHQVTRAYHDGGIPVQVLVTLDKQVVEGRRASFHLSGVLEDELAGGGVPPWWTALRDLAVVALNSLDSQTHYRRRP
jgi:hypothetical protein